MYQPRNPYTPKQGDVLVPQDYLLRYLNFYRWDRENKVTHQETCGHVDRRTLLNSGFCCLNYLKKCIDGQLLEIAGCNSGIWLEPEGFQNWLVLAWKRLEELEDGQDLVDLWTKTFDDHSDEIYAWIRNRFGPNHDNIDIPGFSVASFRSACLKYNYQPDPLLIARSLR